MASIRKRGDKWRVEIRTKGFYKTKSFLHKETAIKWARSIEVSIEDQDNPGSLKLLSDALKRYQKEITPKKKGSRWELIRLNKFLTYPIVNKRLCNLKPSDFSEWRDMRLKQVAPASVRRELGIWSGFFTVCIQEWGWLSENPLKKISKPGSSKSRDRVISAKEQAAIIKVLGKYGARGEVVRMMLLAIETGMRLGEICNIKAGDIFKDYLIIRDSKNNDSRQVPLTQKAKKLVKEATIKAYYASALFREATKKAGVKDVVFHDTRHTAATKLAPKLSVLDLCRMFGWRDPRHAMVYYNPTASELVKRLETA